MNIADELKEIRVFFADNRFVTVLKKVTRAFVAFVEGNSVPGHEATHDFAEWGNSGPQQGMEMVWDQGPGPS